MVIVFDMDNTLTDDFGQQVRPGMNALLNRLQKDGFKLILWTNSTEERAKIILNENRLSGYFSTCIFREGYDPDRQGQPKDIRKVKGDFLVDDDPKQIEFVQSVGRKGFLISPFRNGQKPDDSEINKLHRAIVAANKAGKKRFGWFWH